MPFTYEHPRPGLATDVAVFTLKDRVLQVLLVERALEPFAGAWALPGGFLHPDEDLDMCARRELQEETGVEAPLLRAFGNFSAPGRDPRWVVSAGYFALLPSQELRPRAGSDARTVRWFSVDELPKLAFDHREVLAEALTALRRSARQIKLLLALLPEQFTLTELQTAHDAIMGLPAGDRDNRKASFRKMAKASGAVRETEEFVRGSHRPAQLYVAAVD